jgi:predicted TIM-barrel fold metal-dependent hydrolase
VENKAGYYINLIVILRNNEKYGRMKAYLRFFILSGLLSSFMTFTDAQQRQMKAPGLQDSLLLKDYKPKSIFVIPETMVLKAKYSAIDMHMHAPRGGNLDSIVLVQIRNMDETGVQKTILFCGTGKIFDRYASVYGKYPDRFELWCGFDLTGYDKPGFGPDAIAELERCVSLGARGVGEITDKGSGLSPGKGPAMHLDDPRMDQILEKLADLGLPINVHTGDPKWMYEAMDAKNDLLFEAYYFRLDNKKNILNHEEMIATLERTVKKHPRTTFIACHYMNLTYDLGQLGRLFDKYTNLYADIAQREAYVASIPRSAKQFMEKYADRLVWGTDQGYSLPMYRNSFHILETLDEHFYAWDVSNTRWCLYGLGLNDETLRKLYRENALKILKK